MNPTIFGNFGDPIIGVPSTFVNPQDGADALLKPVAMEPASESESERGEARGSEHRDRHLLAQPVRAARRSSESEEEVAPDAKLRTPKKHKKRRKSAKGKGAVPTAAPAQSEQNEQSTLLRL